MAVFNSFTFDNENSLDYGIYITGEAVYNAPERAVEMVSIPGKNGALALDQGRFENIEVTYPAGAFGAEQAEFADRMRAMRNMLASRYNYVRLTDSYHPDEYRLGLYKSGLEVTPVAMSSAGEFDITFNCKPQRFLTSGEVPLDLTWKYEALEEENSITITDEEGNEIDGGTTPIDTITNPTLFESQPLIIVTGSGQVSIGDQIITVTDIPAGTDVYIDCESMEIYTNTGGIISGASSHVAFNKNSFPTIAPGEQGFSKTAPVQIIPRWWRL